MIWNKIYRCLKQKTQMSNKQYIDDVSHTTQECLTQYIMHFWQAAMLLADSWLKSKQPSKPRILLCVLDNSASSSSARISGRYINIDVGASLHINCIFGEIVGPAAASSWRPSLWVRCSHFLSGLPFALPSAALAWRLQETWQMLVIYTDNFTTYTVSSSTSLVVPGPHDIVRQILFVHPCTSDPFWVGCAHSSVS